MLLFKKVADINSWLHSARKKGMTIGFVPTMGALHEGHLSLIHQSRLQNDITVCSIFVNPKQFNDPKDLENYPRTESRDIKLLEKAGCEALFLPGYEEIYPTNLDTSLDLEFGSLDKTMEGAFRPGHFKGMAQVVKRLLDIIHPNRLYMGQKDFQQYSIVKKMIDTLKIKTGLVMGKTVREPDGLAMSSRNVRLSAEGRQRALVISRVLREAGEKLKAKPPDEVSMEAMKEIRREGLEPEYFEIVDGSTLQPVKRFENATFIVACAAAKVDNVRLIDNMILKGEG